MRSSGFVDRLLMRGVRGGVRWVVTSPARLARWVVGVFARVATYELVALPAYAWYVSPEPVEAALSSAGGVDLGGLVSLVLATPGIVPIAGVVALAAVLSSLSATGRRRNRSSYDRNDGIDLDDFF